MSKKFLILGNQNAINYKEIFPYIKNNELWLGLSIRGGDREFQVPEDYPLEAANCREDKDGNRFIRITGVRWFENINNTSISKKFLDLTKTYNSSDYPVYDNYNAIEVSKVKDIPKDYYGNMGVPLTFLDKFNPNQFEIIDKLNVPFINKKGIYKRLIIKRKI